MPTEISAFKWAWLPLITTRMFGRLFSSVTRTETEESVARRWSCSSRESKEFSNKEDTEVISNKASEVSRVSEDNSKDLEANSKGLEVISNKVSEVINSKVSEEDSRDGDNV